MKKHNFIGSANENVFCIKGIDLFRYKWITTGECAYVVNPETEKVYSFSVYSIAYGNKTLEFVAGKDEYGNWLFFEN